MIISSLKALTGDSFVIKWSNNSLLVDGGMPNTVGEILRKIQHSNLRAVFVTHVDYDHIGGVISLVKRQDVDLSNCSFFMNNPDLASYYDGTDVRFEHGDTLNDILHKRGNEFLPITNDTTPIVIDGLKITPLHPTRAICKELCDSWDLSRVWSEIKGHYSYSKRQKNNGDIINRSSICLVIEHDQKRILMLGDSHADDVVIALKELKEYKFDLVKLSHHGSKHNTNLELLELIECQNYIISTNGNTYNHPDPETIKILSDRAKEKCCNFNIYINYSIEANIRQRYRAQYSCELDNLIFIHQQDIQL